MRDYVPPSEDTWPPEKWHEQVVTPTTFLRRRKSAFRRLLGCVVVAFAVVGVFAVCAIALFLAGTR